MVKSLLAKGYEPTVIDNLSTGNLKVLPRNVAFYDCDISNDAKISDILLENNFCAVFHFAGSIVVSESIENPMKYYDNNTFKTLKFIETCLNHNVTKFIFSSTAAVYGYGTNSKLNEVTRKDPINPYGRSKSMIEDILRDLEKSNRLNYVILRYFNVAGAEPDGTLGPISKNAAHLIKVASEVALGRRPFLEIYGDDYDTQDGSCVRDFIHIKDLINAHLKSLEYLLSNKGSEIFNCGYGEGFSVFEIVKVFENILGKNLSTKIVDRRKGDPPYLVADNKKIINELNWDPEFNNINKIIEHSLKWEKTLKNFLSA